MKEKWNKAALVAALVLVAALLWVGDLGRADAEEVVCTDGTCGEAAPAEGFASTAGDRFGQAHVAGVEGSAPRLDSAFPVPLSPTLTIVDGNQSKPPTSSFVFFFAFVRSFISCALNCRGSCPGRCAGGGRHRQGLAPPRYSPVRPLLGAVMIAEFLTTHRRKANGCSSIIGGQWLGTDESIFTAFVVMTAAQFARPQANAYLLVYARVSI